MQVPVGTCHHATCLGMGERHRWEGLCLPRVGTQPVHDKASKLACHMSLHDPPTVESQVGLHVVALEDLRLPHVTLWSAHGRMPGWVAPRRTGSTGLHPPRSTPIPGGAHTSGTPLHQKKSSFSCWACAAWVCQTIRQHLLGCITLEVLRWCNKNFIPIT
jgi:hypothetical protein